MPHNEFTVATACSDLIFGARIRAAVAAVGGRTIMLSGREDATARIRAEHPDLVIVELDARWLSGPAFIAELKARPETAAIPVLAFGSHVAVEVLAAARQAGAEQVLARSAFVRQLSDLLRSYAAR